MVRNDRNLKLQLFETNVCSAKGGRGTNDKRTNKRKLKNTGSHPGQHTGNQTCHMGGCILALHQLIYGLNAHLSEVVPTRVFTDAGVSPTRCFINAGVLPTRVRGAGAVQCAPECSQSGLRGAGACLPHYLMQHVMRPSLRGLCRARKLWRPVGEQSSAFTVRCREAGGCGGQLSTNSISFRAQESDRFWVVCSKQELYQPKGMSTLQKPDQVHEQRR